MKTERAIKVCRKHHPAAKIIRMHDILPLKRLKDSLDFKAIFLIRDPRAILASRMKIFESEFYVSRGISKNIKDMLNILEENCDFMIKNHEIIYEFHEI